MARILSYPADVRYEPADGWYHVYFRDFPEAVASGETPKAALDSAADALAAAIEVVLVDERPWREPSPAQRDDVLLPVPPQLAAKAIVYRAWREAKISKSALAERMGKTENVARRILDPRHASPIDQLAEAAKVLGVRLVIGEEAA